MKDQGVQVLIDFVIPDLFPALELKTAPNYIYKL